MNAFQLDACRPTEVAVTLGADPSPLEQPLPQAGRQPLGADPPGAGIPWSRCPQSRYP